MQRFCHACSHPFYQWGESDDDDGVDNCPLCFSALDIIPETEPIVQAHVIETEAGNVGLNELID